MRLVGKMFGGHVSGTQLVCVCVCNVLSTHRKMLSTPKGSIDERLLES